MEAQRLHAGDHGAGRRRSAGRDLDRPRESATRLLGRVDQHGQHHGRPAHVRHPLALDQLEDPGRFDLPQADMGGADRGHGPGEGPAVAVEHRQGPEIDRARIEAEDQGAAHGVQEGAAVVIDDALGIAGRARGVAERDRVPFVRGRRPVERGIARRQQRLVVHDPEALARCRRIDDVDDDDIATGMGQRLPDHRCQLGIRQQHLGLAMLQDEADRGPVEPGVEGVEHGTQHRDAVVRLEHGRRVRAHHRHRVAAADPEPGQRARQPAAA